MSLKNQAALGARWTLLSTVAITLIQLTQVVILARILTPLEFGLIGIVMILVGFVQGFADLGLANAVILEKEIPTARLNSIFWGFVLAGIGLYLGTVMVASPIFVVLSGEPRIRDLISWSALTLIISSFGRMHLILLQKNLQFPLLTKIEMVGTLAGFTVAVYAASKGAGAFAFIWGQIVDTSVRSSISFLLGLRFWRPGLKCRFPDSYASFRFGLFQTGERSVNYLASNFDYFFVGRFLGPSALGIYTMAYQFSVLSVLRLNPAITKVALPIFSMKQTDIAALRKGYLEMTKVISRLVFPCLFGLAATAPLFVSVFYGRAWHESSILMQILFLAGIIKALGNPQGSVLLAMGRSDIGFYWNVGAAVLNLIVFSIAAQFDLVVVSWAWVVLSSLYMVAGVLLIQKIVSIPWTIQVSVLYVPTASSILMALILTLLRKVLENTGIAQDAILGTLVCVGIISYGILLYRLEPNFVHDLIALLMNRQHRRA